VRAQLEQSAAARRCAKVVTQGSGTQKALTHERNTNLVECAEESNVPGVGRVACRVC